MDSDRKVHESLDAFIRETMGREPYMSFISRPEEKSLQRIIENQEAMNKCVKSLKVDIDICDGLEDNAHVELHQVDIENNFCGIKEERSLERRLQTDLNLQTIKNNIPQVVAAFTTTKNLGKQSLAIDHLIDLPNWTLLSPSKVQLQKCEKCSHEFFSTFNHRRHIRIHRRISQVDKEDLQIKKKNIAAFWDKLNQDDVQQIFVSSKKYNLEDLSGEVVVRRLLAFKKQKNSMILPATYTKAGQDLLNILDNKEIVFPLFSEQILSILDEASEKTFLCSQVDVSKIGLEEINLIASLGFIVEQTLVKAWMVDKDAEALRNQQELVKEEEVAQMKRERILAKKKKKEKSRQKRLQERKVGISKLTPNEGNDSIDGENRFLEEDNSPTTSSMSLNSPGLENPLIELLEMDVINKIQNNDGRIHNIVEEDRYFKSKDILSTYLTLKKKIKTDFVDEHQMQHSECDMTCYRKDGKLSFNFPSYNRVKVEDREESGHILDQEQNIVEIRKRTSLKPYKELTRVDYQDSYQKRSWVSDPRFQEGTQQNSYRTLQKSSIGISHISNNEFGSSLVSGFYHSKPMNLRRIASFSTTQQWTKKVQTPIIIDQIMDGHEEKNSQENGIFISKSNANDLNIEHTIQAHEKKADTINNTNRVEKEEFEILEKKEPSSNIIPSVAKIVANTGGSSNIPTTSFNFNVNLEEWPPLPNSQTTYYQENTRMYSLKSYHSELNSRHVNKFNIDREDDCYTKVESQLEKSVITNIPPIKGLNNETTIESASIALQKGIIIGSVTVPLGDYVHSSRPGLESISRKICSTSLPMHQSYTTVLVTPPIQYTQESIASTTRQQKIHDGIYHSNFKDSSSVQVMDSHGDQSYYRTLSSRSTPSMNLNIKHVRQSTYPLRVRGERGIFSKQPSWLEGPICHLPQKVWRPIRSTSENVDSNPNGKIDFEKSLASANEKINAKHINNEENNNATLPLVENMQVEINCEAIIPLNSEHLQYCQKTTGVISNTKVDDKNTCQHVKNHTTEKIINCISCAKKNNIKKMDDNAHMETTPNHSTWIAEAIEFHLNRWQLALKDPETIISNCEEKHLELQTSKWIDFMNNLPSIVPRFTFWKEDCHNLILRTVDDSNQIKIENFKNLPDGQQLTNARHEGSVIVSIGKELQDSCLIFENESPYGVASTIKKNCNKITKLLKK